MISQELVTKIENKLGSALDLVNFENAKEIGNYIADYLRMKAFFSFVVFMMLFIFSCAFFTTNYKKFNDDIDDPMNWAIALSFGGVAIGLLGTIINLYALLIAYRFPIIAIFNWLK